MKKIFLIFIGFYLSVQDIFWAKLDDFFKWNKEPAHLTKLVNEWTWEEAILILIAQVVDLMLYFAWTIAVWFIIYWWVRLITDFWTDSWKEDAKKIVLHSIVWLLVIFISIILVENTERFIRFIVWSWSL